MALNIDPYKIDGVFLSDNYMTHYNCLDEDGVQCQVTEFFPAYMAHRDDETGELVVSETFSVEFSESRQEFLRRAEEYGKVDDDSLHPLSKVFLRNGTAYMVRPVCGLTTVESYMAGQHMDYDEAFHFIRPALLALAKAAEQKLLFKLGLKDFRVNHLRKLVASGIPVWETDFHPTLKQIVRLYYKLVTGVEAAESNTPGFAIYGIAVPPRVEAVVMEALNGEILYGSLYDFFKQFKSLIDTSQPNARGDGKALMRVLRGAAAVLFAAFLGASVFFVRAAVQSRRAETFWTNPEFFAGSELPPAPALDFSAYTLTHPTSGMDPVTGTFAVHDGFMFFRDREGIMRRRVEDMMVIPGATGVLAVHDDTIVLAGARPSFMVGHAEFLYFVDSGAGGAIHRMLVNGDGLERITEHPALNLQIVDGLLYYTRPDMGHHLFRLNPDNLATELVFPMPVFAALSDGVSRLYVLAGDLYTENSGLYALDMAAYETLPLAGGVGGAVRLFMDRLYFLDMHGRINVMGTNGQDRETLPPENVRSFDVFFQWVVYTEHGRNVPRAFNTSSRRDFTISGTDWLSYVWVREDTIYGLDHRNPFMSHTFPLPGN